MPPCGSPLKRTTKSVALPVSELNASSVTIREDRGAIPAMRHMLKPRPPLAPAAGVMALMSAERRGEKSGRVEQSAKAGPAAIITRALIEHESIRCWDVHSAAPLVRWTMG